MTHSLLTPNTGENYSGAEFLLEPKRNIIQSTYQYDVEDATIVRNYKNMTFLSTFAVYTYVYPQYWYRNPEIMDMEKKYCAISRYPSNNANAISAINGLTHSLLVGIRKRESVREKKATSC